MPGPKGYGGGSIFCDQILFHRKSKFIQLNSWKYNVCGIKLELIVLRLHIIRVEKISFFF